jgi:hypothetical protein
MCADFGDLVVKTIGGGTGTKIVSKSSTAPADCDDFTAPTTTTLPGGTTTTTLPATRIAFVTSASFTGGGSQGFGGLTGADARCNTAASAAGLPGTYLAWLSHCSANASPSSRFSDGAPWARVDGPVVATDLADLLDGTLQNPLDVDETGTQVPAGTDVWTGPLASGTSAGQCTSNTCNDWTTTASGSLGLTGEASLTTMQWTQDDLLLCSNAFRL